MDMVLQGLILNSLCLNLEESEGIRWWGKGDIFLVIYGRIHQNDLLRWQRENKSLEIPCLHLKKRDEYRLEV